jgi:Kef-type K+ transport system membrane component KefB
MIALAQLLLAATVAFGIYRWLRLPVIPLMLGTGILLSITGLAPAAPFSENILQLGLAFLMFVAGAELTPRKFSAQARVVRTVAGIQFAAIGILGYAIALLLGYPQMIALYIAFALCASSTLVVVRHLKQQQQLFEPFGRVVLGVLLLQDLAIIIVIIVLAKAPEGLVSLATGLGGFTLLAWIALLCQRRIMPRIMVELGLDEETLLLAALATLFAFAGLAHALGLPPVTGAFLAGFSLSAFPVNGVIRGLLSSLSDFFLAVFFVALGTLVVMPDGTLLLHALLFAAFVVVVTPVAVTIVAMRSGLTARSAIESGLLLAQTSEFSMVIAITGVALGHIPPALFSVIALVTVLTMTLTPFVATDRTTRYLLSLFPGRRSLGLGIDGAPSGHVLLLGFGAAGMWVVKPLLAAGHKLLVVDDDPAVVEQLERAGIPSMRGDGSDQETLARAGARNARLIIATMRRVEDAHAVILHVGKVPVVVRVFEFADAERIRQLGGIPILNSVAAADTFMDWFERDEAPATAAEAPPASPASG